MKIQRALRHGFALVVGLALILPALSVSAAPPPTVTAIAPSGGSAAGGTTLTITGTGFASGVTVTVAGFAAAAVALTGSTQITARTPAHTAGSAAVIVTNLDTQSAASPTNFTYTASPTVTPTVTEFSAGITAISNTAGVVAGPDGNLWFAEKGINKIGRITPVGTVTEFAAGITAGSGTNFIATGPDGNLWFTERDGDRIGRATISPRLLGVAPPVGPTAGGTVVTLTGVNFLAGATVTFDGIAGTSVAVVSATQITVTAPAHPATGTVDIVVTNPNGGTDTLVLGYTYGNPNPLPPP